MLETIKKMMGICNDSFDLIIKNYIIAAKQDLSATGVIVDESNPIIQSAIVSYCLSLLDIDNAQMYSNAYALQKDQLRYFKEYSR